VACRLQPPRFPGVPPRFHRAGAAAGTSGDSRPLGGRADAYSDSPAASRASPAEYRAAWGGTPNAAGIEGRRGG
jgi:hypothetical protein